jgi:hypothetical protein
MALVTVNSNKNIQKLFEWSDRRIKFKIILDIINVLIRAILQ